MTTNMRGNKNETGEGDNNVEYSFKTVVLLDLPLQGWCLQQNSLSIKGACAQPALGTAKGFKILCHNSN